MDGSQFDLLTRNIAASFSRRATLGTLGVGVLALRALVQAGTGLAKKKGKKNKKKKKKKKCQNDRDRCGNKCCESGETCRQGKCVNCCLDEILNCGETDIDCGRVCAGIPGSGLCGLRRKCAGAEDCTSGKCVRGECVECLIDSECTSPIFRRCLDNFCFECAIDADCPSSFGSPTERLCVVIEDCPRNQPCVCRQCRQDADCPPQRPHCNTGVNSILGKLCFQCLVDDHCPPSQLCEQGRCEGFVCESNQDCPSGRACENGACTGTCVPPGGIIDEGECCSGVECISGPDDICCDFGQICTDLGGGDQCA